MMDSMIRKIRKVHHCGHCPKAFVKPSELKRHIRTHTGEKHFTCDVCHKAFTQAQHLKSHIRVHTGERPYECKVCHASFKQSSALKKHERLHMENVPNEILSGPLKVKRYFCKWCSRTYKPSFFKYHKCVPNQVQLRVPRSSKCFVCGQEPIDNIKLHVLLHDEYKPYQCWICQLGFSTVSNWKEHVMKEQCKHRPSTMEGNQVAEGQGKKCFY